MNNLFHSPVAKNGLLFKIFTLVVVTGVIVIAVPLLTYLQIAFGWTNPSQNPPGGSGLLTAANGNIGIGVSNPLTAKLVVNGAIDVMTNKILGVATPTASSDAANKAYVDASGGGGGAVALFYKTDTSNPGLPVPSCPAGWTEQYNGYGPHYIGIYGYDWLNGGTGGTGGGFGGVGGPQPPPGAGSNYILNAMAIGSDSVCSQYQTSTVPFASMFLNKYTYYYAKMNSDACATDPVTGVITCNRCKECTK